MDSLGSELYASFPYAPYDIQKQFMKNVYETLESKQIGLLESPTGTGKTLSVICSTLKWLEDERLKAQERAAASQADDDAGLPDWITGAAATATPPQQQQGQQRKQPKRQVKPAVLDEAGNDLSEFLLADEPPAAAAAAATVSPGSKRSVPDSGYCSSDSNSDTDTLSAAAVITAEEGPGSAAVEQKQPQVIFCSRTHSQLSQFVGELHRTRFAASMLLVAVGSRKALCVNDEVRQLSELSQINERCMELQRNKASSNSSSKSDRTSNPRSSKTAAMSPAEDVSAHAGGNSRHSVVGLSAAPQRQQRAARSSSHKAKSGCPFLSVDAAAWDSFRDAVLGPPIDVEELANLGRKHKVCPYYGSRRAVPAADVVLAPYSAVLMRDARDSLGIQLQDSVLVFDEAHNLLDAINGAHCTAVTAWQLMSVQRSFSAYYERFKAFLSPVNSQHLQQLLHIAAALHKCLQHHPQQQQQQPQLHEAGRVMSVNDLLFDLGLDNINMFELARWVRDNKMAFKVSGYTAAAVAKAGGRVELQQPSSKHERTAAAAAAVAAAAAAGGAATAVPSSSTEQQSWQQELGQLSSKDGVSAIHSFVSFLLSLTNLDADGRIIIEPADRDGSHSSSRDTTPTAPAAGTAAGRGGRLRYVLLNAARHFGALLSSAHAVLLVSGTLAPIDGLKAQLFPGIAPDRIRHFECGHVVPAQQLLAVSVGRGPSGKALNLKHDARGDAALMDELGQLLLNLAGVVPEGLVVFVASFGYLEQLVGRWQSSGLWGRLAQRKQVFREPRSASDVDKVLAAYAAAICGTNSSSSTDPPPSAGTAAKMEGSRVTASTPAAPGAASNTGVSKSEAGRSSSGSGPCGAAAAAPAAGPGFRKPGAVMLCVVGGKLSEGINFGDGLGRCVVVVGMPYPNRTDLELQERMAYLDKQAAQAATSRGSQEAAAAAATPQQAAEMPHAPQDQPGQQQQQQLQQAGQQAQQALAGPPAHRGVFRPINQAVMRPPGHPAKRMASSSSNVGKPPAAPDPQQVMQAATAGAAAATSSAPPGSEPSTGNTHSSNSSSSSNSALGALTGRAYYEDLCFKAVNQCVGRVVRHSQDYAAVVLVDMRWVAGPAEWQAASHSSSNKRSSRAKLPVQKLPGWLQRSYVATNGDFGPAFKQLAGFFRQQQRQQPAECATSASFSQHL